MPELPVPHVAEYGNRSRYILCRDLSPPDEDKPYYLPSARKYFLAGHKSCRLCGYRYGFPRCRHKQSSSFHERFSVLSHPAHQTPQWRQCWYYQRRQPFQTEVTSFRNRNFHFLPTVTWFESTGRYRCFLLQFDGLPLFTMRFRNSHTKHIQDRFVSIRRWLPLSGLSSQERDFIHSFFQPAARHEQVC